MLGSDEQVIDKDTGDRNGQQAGIDGDSKSSSKGISWLPTTKQITHGPSINVNGHEGEGVETEEIGKEKKMHKVSIVSATNAIRNPRTVMVKLLHTIVTVAAMRTPGRPKDLACRAVLEEDSLITNDHFLAEEEIWVLVVKD